MPTTSEYAADAANEVAEYAQRAGIGVEVELVSLALALAAAAAAWVRWGRPRWHGVKRAVSGLLDLGRDASAVLASVERSTRVAESVQAIQHSTALLIGKMRAHHLQIMQDGDDRAPLALPAVQQRQKILRCARINRRKGLIKNDQPRILQ